MITVGTRVTILGHDLPSAKGRTGVITEMNVQGPRKRVVRHSVRVDFHPHEDPRHIPSCMHNLAIRETDMVEVEGEKS